MNRSFLNQQGIQKGLIWLFVEIGMQLLQDGLSICRIDDFLITLRCEDCGSRIWRGFAWQPGRDMHHSFQDITSAVQMVKHRGLTLHNFRKKCSLWSLCVWFFLSFSPFVLNINFHLYKELYYGKKDSSCTQCDGWQTPCGLQGRIKWNISNIFMYLFFPRWGKDRWACPYCVTLLTQHCSLWMFRSIFWLYPFKKNQLPLTIVGLLYDEQELLVKENQHL